jgi:hypothetical protein
MALFMSCAQPPTEMWNPTGYWRRIARGVGAFWAIYLDGDIFVKQSAHSFVAKR